MNNEKPVLYCCDEEATWVENVPGKGYSYCKHCKQEVLTPKKVEEPYNDYISAITHIGYDTDDLQDLLDSLDQLGSYRNPTTKLGTRYEAGSLASPTNSMYKSSKSAIFAELMQIYSKDLAFKKYEPLKEEKSYKDRKDTGWFF